MSETKLDEIAQKADWAAAWTELFGYVTEAANEGGTSIDPAYLHGYMRELKNTHVTGPIRAELARIREAQ